MSPTVHDYVRIARAGAKNAMKLIDFHYLFNRPATSRKLYYEGSTIQKSHSQRKVSTLIPSTLRMKPNLQAHTLPGGRTEKVAAKIEIGNNWISGWASVLQGIPKPFRCVRELTYTLLFQPASGTPSGVGKSDNFWLLHLVPLSHVL